MSPHVGVAVTRLAGSRWFPAVFGLVVVAHFAEHAAQAVQVYALGMPRPSAQGLLGLVAPWLVSSELLHYGHALAMLAGMLMLRSRFRGPARVWWSIAIGLQVWHHAEHLLLLGQAWTGLRPLGGPSPTSVLQLVVPRIELHIVYNVMVLGPMSAALMCRPPPVRRGHTPSAHRRRSLDCRAAVRRASPRASARS